MNCASFRRKLHSSVKDWTPAFAGVTEAVGVRPSEGDGYNAHFFNVARNFFLNFATFGATTAMQ